MRPQRPSLSEKTAAIAYARAFNTHDLSLLAPLVHDRLHVFDQRNWTPREGSNFYLGMIGDYFELVPPEKCSMTMELAVVPQAPINEGTPRPCVIEYHGGRPVCTILFQVHGGKIRRIEKRLLPPPTECQLTGVYPGLDTGPTEEVN